MGQNRNLVGFPTSMYDSIAQAETGGETNKFIRTKVRPPGGSTAFGPVQLTGKTAGDFVNRGLVSPQSAQFYNSEMAPMYQNFSKYGHEPARPGYSPAYDYGGTGNFNVAQDAQGYHQLATDVMSQLWKQANGNPQRFIQLWRGTTAAQDPKYFQSVMDNFQGSQ